MGALSTVSDYIAEARVILQDTLVPYRYSDTELVTGLNLGLLEARRLRPDLFVGRLATVPSFTVVDATEVSWDQQYRMALVYYVCGNAHARDEENTEDARAAAFLNKFVSQMLTIQS